MHCAATVWLIDTITVPSVQVQYSLSAKELRTHFFFFCSMNESKWAAKIWVYLRIINCILNPSQSFSMLCRAWGVGCVKKKSRELVELLRTGCTSMPLLGNQHQKLTRWIADCFLTRSDGLEDCFLTRSDGLCLCDAKEGRCQKWIKKVRNEKKGYRFIHGRRSPRAAARQVWKCSLKTAEASR